MNNQIPKIKIDGERAINLMKMFDLTETELELMNNILSEHHKNKTELSSVISFTGIFFISSKLIVG